MLSESSEIEELADMFGDFISARIERRGAKSNRHIVVTNRNGVHKILYEGLDCRKPAHDGPDNSLNV